MKKLFLTFATLAVVLSSIAEQKPNRRRSRPSKPSGGIVERPQQGKVFRVRNTVAELPAEQVEKLTRTIRHTAILPIEAVSGGKVEGCPFAAAERLLSEKNVAAGLLVVDDAKLPISVIASDRKWSILNIAPFKADSPTAEKLFERFTKAYWATIARTLGAGYSSYPGCVLVPFTNIRELDAIKAMSPCPEPFNKMLETAQAWGMNKLSIASYRTACQQGWAAAPTNDVQKAIWEEVHKLPTAPIKIKPETKKVEK